MRSITSITSRRKEEEEEEEEEVDLLSRVQGYDCEVEWGAW